jgi:hypothetical protein
VSVHPDIEELEALALGQRAPSIEAHAEQCAECAREVAWLRAEQALIARRPAVEAGRLWPAIEQRLSQAPELKPRIFRPRWALRVRVAVASVAAAAALVLIFLRTRPAQQPGASSAAASSSGGAEKAREEYRPDPKTLAALDRAETDYRDAAKILEAEYDRLRPNLDPKLAKRWDETLTRAHAQLGEARAVAGNDVNARMQVLDGYAGYVRSLRTLVTQTEEVTP